MNTSSKRREAVQVFLPVTEGEGGHLYSPLSTIIALFVSGYCSGEKQNKGFNIIFVRQNHDQHYRIPEHLLDHDVSWVIDDSALPETVSLCLLPAALSHKGHLVHSGLCAVLRVIVKAAQAEYPKENCISLLGHKQCCLKACSEVSSWTKFCELDLPCAVESLLGKMSVVHKEGQEVLEIPLELLKLERHLSMPAIIPNKIKRQREVEKWRNTRTPKKTGKENGISSGDKNDKELSKLLDSASKLKVSDQQESKMSFAHPCGNENKDNRKTELDITESSWRDEKFVNSTSVSVSGSPESRTALKTDASEPTSMPTLEHLYAEGTELTLTDVVLYPCIHLFLQSTSNHVVLVEEKLPLVIQWYKRLSCLHGFHAASHWVKLDEVRTNQFSFHGQLVVPDHGGMEDLDIRPVKKSKAKTKEMDIAQTLEKIKLASISPVMSDHPCGDQIQLDWDALPLQVHPQNGDLPKKRLQKKCQQLENLASAVLKIAQTRDVVVDFCSGGGHLGLVLAYLLPKCQVLMIDNKEESILRALDRVMDLELTNASLYQCNVNYFRGSFNIGVSLHACGVATDLVLNKCLQNEAAFVICPCCYGSIQNTQTVTYPRSREFRDVDMDYMDYISLGHAADQTEFTRPLAKQGKFCMGLLDTDRGHLAKNQGYDVTLCSLQPLDCTPKNNLLIGVPVNRQ